MRHYDWADQEFGVGVQAEDKISEAHIWPKTEEYTVRAVSPKLTLVIRALLLIHFKE